MPQLSIAGSLSFGSRNDIVAGSVTGSTDWSDRKAAPKELVVQLSRPDAPLLQEIATTQNVSAGGVRLVTQRIWRPGDLVLLSSPDKNLHTGARVVYCQRLGDKGFAVGLELLVPVEDWRNPP